MAASTRPCAVAAAIGYSFDYTADELAAKAAGFNVPVINAQQGMADFEELLLVLEQACNELRAEGALREKRELLGMLASTQARNCASACMCSS